MIGYKRKSNNNKDTDAGTREGSGDTSDREQGGKNHKTRKYDSSYLSLGFTSVIIDGLEKPMCLFCTKVLAADSMRPRRLNKHLTSIHFEYVGKPTEFFQRKLDEFNKQKQTFKKIDSVLKCIASVVPRFLQNREM